MKEMIKSFFNGMLANFGYRVITLDYLKILNDKCDMLVTKEKENDDVQFLLAMPEKEVNTILHELNHSHSQYRQDLFVLSELNFKRGGYFIEFGATNGVGNSNTYILEKNYGWSGILAEPAKRWHNDLKNNRKVNIETDCVWSKSGETLTFIEVASCTELSTLKKFSSSDLHSNQRNAGVEYDVRTISLLDLLKRHNSPKTIDYLSIDTEGSEYEILSYFDFDAYDIKIISCEHNYTEEREKIHELLSRNGYIRKYQNISKVDDWYVRSND
jgi:FkbM family methyltransferase